jgi:hypothetical protein
MRKLQTNLSLAGLAIAAIALIPSFGQWLFPRSPTQDGPADAQAGSAPGTEFAASPANLASAPPFDQSTDAPRTALPVVPVAQINYPEDGATVEKFVTVGGTISGLKGGEKAFLCVKSTAFGRLIFPQAELFPDANGRWSASAIYSSIGYRYETFVATAPDTEAAQVLGDGYHRSYGMRSLPESSSVVGPVITVERR